MDAGFLNEARLDWAARNAYDRRLGQARPCSWQGQAVEESVRQRIIDKLTRLCERQVAVADQSRALSDTE